MGSCPAQDLALLLQQPIATTQVAQLGELIAVDARLCLRVADPEPGVCAASFR